MLQNYHQLKERINENFNNADVLHLLLNELKYRKRNKAIELRQYVTERLADLSKQSFHWPSTAVMESHSALSGNQFWYERGLLSFLGYAVGQTGAFTSERRRVLDYTYNKIIPRVHSHEYMEEWGEPQTSQRLKKIARSIASFARTAKRKVNSDMQMAITEWEQDLSYLKKTYYKGIYDFSWPSTKF